VPQNKGPNEYAREKEVIVAPGHNARLATPQELKPYRDPHNPDIHGRINIAGRMAARPTHQDERLRSRVTANRLRTAHAGKLPPKTAGRQPPETDDPLERAERRYPIELDHYSPLRGLRTIDPSFQGTGAFGLHGQETQRQSRIPRTYYYEADTEPESTFKTAVMQRYRVKLPPNAKLYDIGKDPEKLMRPKWRNTDEGRFYEPPDLDDVEHQIRKRGYHGYKNYHPSIPNAVAVFYKQKATPVASKPESAPTTGLEKTDVEVLMQHPSRAERMMALKLPGVSHTDVRRGVEDPDAQVALAALRHPLVDPEILTQALAHSAPNVRIAAAQHPKCDATHIEQALSDTNPMVRRALATSPNLDPHQLQQLLDDGDPKVLEVLATHPRLTPEQAVAIMVNPGVNAQTKLKVMNGKHLTEKMQAQLAPQLQAGFQRSAREWLDLRKDRGTPTFPKMGLGDNKRETPIIHTTKELETKAALYGQKRANVTGQADEGVKERAMLRRNPGYGMTYTGPGAGTGETNIAYSTSPELREKLSGKKYDPQNINTWISSNPNAGQATKLHEDLHQMFNRVQAKHGLMGRKIFAHNLYYSMPSEVRSHVYDFTTARDPSTKVWAQNGAIQSDHNYPFEERMALMLNYLNNPGERGAYHKHMRHDPDDVRVVGTAIKRAHQHLLAAAQTAPEAWAQQIQPWAQKLTKTEDPHQEHEEPESVSAEAAHQTGNVVRHQDDDHVVPLADPDFVDDFEGHHLDEDEAFDAARFLAGGKARLPAEQMRTFVWEEDGDLEAAALRAYGMDVNARTRAALQGVLNVILKQKLEGEPLHRDVFAVHNTKEHLGKAETFETEPRPKEPTSVEPGTATADDVADAVRNAYKEHEVEVVSLKGKHSKGTSVAHDSKSEETWLLKPGSGPPSPAAGIADSQGSQSAREAAFYACAKHVFGLAESLPRCELLLIDGKPVAAMKFLPPEFKSLEKRAKDDSMRVLWSLHTYLKTGLLHKWAVMDWILGNVDRHGQNILANGSQPERMYLIDHGSTFAGVSFDPAHDRSSFVPYYLRAWAPRKFNTLEPAEKLRRMPVADPHVEILLRDWVAGLHSDALAGTIARFGLDPGPCLQRLAHVKELLSNSGVQDFSKAINSLWVG
jgi:hypothetical protein